MRNIASKLLGALALSAALQAGSARAAPPPTITRNPALDAKLEQQVLPALNAFATAWNQGDVQGMANAFSNDAVLINPMGQLARGRAEIQKLLQQEQQGMMKGSQFSFRVTDLRQVAPGLAYLDEEITIAGWKNPAGQPMPDLRLHGAMLLTNQAGTWQILEGRPYQFINPAQQQAVGGSGADTATTPTAPTPPTPPPPATPEPAPIPQP